MGLVVAATLLSALGAGLAFSPNLAGSWLMWVAFGLCQAPIAGIALRRFIRDGEVREVLQPKWGDISVGALSAILLLGGAWAVRMAVTPSGSPQEGWLMRAYLQPGDPEMIQRAWLPVALGILAITVLVELGWRGLVLRVLEQRWGTRRAWPATSLLYGCSFLPSAWLLRTDTGPNFLVVAAAVAGGFVWTYLAVRSRRLVPSILSHALFVWFVVVQFRLFTIRLG